MPAATSQVQFSAAPAVSAIAQAEEDLAGQ
jgi:hypothetical protein